MVDVASMICPGCSGTLHRIGEDVAERLEIVPTQFRVLVVRRPKYSCRSCEDVVVQAAAPARLIEGGLPTEATVAQVLVSKYADHRVSRTRQRWRCGAVREMRVGPSEPAIRSRLQTTASCCRKERWW